jgi:hypothetical protein
MASVGGFASVRPGLPRNRAHIASRAVSKDSRIYVPTYGRHGQETPLPHPAALGHVGVPREGQLLRPCLLLAERGRDLLLGAAAKPRPKSYSASLVSPPLPTWVPAKGNVLVT